MVATSATRDARNRDDFREMVQDVLGVVPEVVSGDEEAALSFDGATRGLDPAHGPFLVMDIGGGSTELVLGTSSPQAALSVDVGCVRSPSATCSTTRRPRRRSPARRPTSTRPSTGSARRAGRAGPHRRRARRLGHHGGRARARPGGLRRRAHHLSRISAADVADVASRLLAMTRAERAALPVMHPGRVDVIGAGALVLATLVDRLGLADVVVSEADILDGIAWSVA
jgi:exopolyphosphatase/guanosine-5'-triphosphate,3'-diphosphate pyrophosphatase